LKKRGHKVTTVMTKHACELVSPNTFLNLTGNRVYTDLFAPGDGQTEHIKLTDEADLVVLAPATANTIAKLALGLADDMLSTTLLAVRCPVLLCPAMNTRMWDHPTVQRNLAVLRQQGVRVLEPDAGALACGHVGPGRLVEPEEIHVAVEALLLEMRTGKAPVKAPSTAPAKIPSNWHLFLEQQEINMGASTDEIEAERRYRSALVGKGHLIASGSLAGSSGAVHIHHASSLEEARERAERSPLVLAGSATFELAEWKLDSGELDDATRESLRRHDPEAPTQSFRLSK
jgi:hypothetical protein